MKKFYLIIFTILLAMGASTKAQTGDANDPIPLSLGGIILHGSDSKFYTITNKLYGVYVPPRYKNVIFAKDNNNNPHKSKPSTQQEADNKIYDNESEFDQSSWIKIYFPAGYDASQYVGKEIANRAVTGRINVANTPAGPVGIFVDVLDPSTPLATSGTSSYGGNTYNCANFVQQEWFFVKPKNLEYCNIRWAVYNGDNMFYVPSNSDWPGSFKVDMTLWEEQNDAGSITADQVFTPGRAYEFPAIVQFSKDYQVGLDIDPGFDGDFNYDAPRLRNFTTGNAGTLPEGYRNVVVFPLRLNKEVITAIDEVESGKSVTSVSYCDLQGRMSDKPLRGVNIKVTTYSDGTRETMKIVK